MRVGFTFRPERPLGELPSVARAAEAAGYDELWLWEDCFLAGGFAAAATALAASGRIAVGLGVLPAVLRNPAVIAMEAASLAVLHPGRLLLGLGHGVPAWMAQVGALPERPVRALEEITRAVRGLLRGETVTVTGDQVRLREVRLGAPPAVAPPVLLGVRAPFGLRASGRSADGTILAEPSAPAYIDAARAQIERGRARAGRTDPHRLVVYVRTRLDPDRGAIRAALAGMVLDPAYAAQLAPLDRDAELARLRALEAPDAVAGSLPDDLVDALAAAGDAAQVIAALRAVVAAGADGVVLVPEGDDPDAQLHLLARDVVPALRAAAASG